MRTVDYLNLEALYTERLIESCDDQDWHGVNDVHSVLYNYIVNKRGIGAELSYDELYAHLLLYGFEIPAEDEKQRIWFIDLHLMRIAEELRRRGEQVELVIVSIGAVAIAPYVNSKTHPKKLVLTEEVTFDDLPQLPVEPVKLSSQMGSIEPEEKQPPEAKLDLTDYEKQVISYIDDNGPVITTTLLNYITTDLTMSTEQARAIISKLKEKGLIKRIKTKVDNNQTWLYYTGNNPPEIKTTDIDVNNNRPKNNEKMFDNREILKQILSYICNSRSDKKYKLTDFVYVAQVLDVFKGMEHRHIRIRVQRIINMLVSKKILIKNDDQDTYKVVNREIHSKMIDDFELISTIDFVLS